MPDQATEASQPTSSHSLPALSLAALGVVFGDIGTSPLYALKAVLDVTTENPPTEILGALSLIVWTLIIITSVKYITLAMRVDNDGLSPAYVPRFVDGTPELGSSIAEPSSRYWIAKNCRKMVCYSTIRRAIDMGLALIESHGRRIPLAYRSS